MAHALVPNPPSSMLLAMLPAPADLGDVAGRLAGLGPVERQDDHLTLAGADLRVEVGVVALPSEGLSKRLRRDSFTAARLDHARDALGLKAVLPRDAPLRGLQRLYRVAEAATGGAALLWYDVEKERQVDREEVAILSNDDLLPSVVDAIEIDCVFVQPSSPTYWFHTHGVARLGRPDLEAFDVPVARRGEALGLVNDVAAWLLENDLPPGGGEVTLTDGSVWLEPLRAQLERLPPGTLGKDIEDRNPDEQEIDRRMALVLPRRWGRGRLFRRRFTHDLEPILTRRSETTVRPMMRTEGERRRALARRTLPLLTTLWAQRDPAWTFWVQLGLPTSEPSVLEHVWVEVAAVEDLRVRGRLDNEPDDLPDRHLGDLLEEDLTLATQWYVRAGTSKYGPLRAHRLLGPEIRSS